MFVSEFIDPLMPTTSSQIFCKDRSEEEQHLLLVRFFKNIILRYIYNVICSAKMSKSVLLLKINSCLVISYLLLPAIACSGTIKLVFRHYSMMRLRLMILAGMKLYVFDEISKNFCWKFIWMEIFSAVPIVQCRVDENFGPQIADYKEFDLSDPLYP